MRYGDRAVHIKTDAALVEYLGEAGNGARALAEEILREYEKRAGKPLDIGLDSLAIEILIHTFLDTFAGRALHLAEKLPARWPSRFPRCWKDWRTARKSSIAASAKWMATAGYSTGSHLFTACFTKFWAIRRETLNFSAHTFLGETAARFPVA